MNKLGFGFLRLPMVETDNGGKEIDIAETCRMTDAFIEAGFNYFDTAHGYISGRSEGAIKACLTSRYPRESFILTDKLTDEYFDSEEEILPLFEKQLELCGVDYFDNYLMHSMTAPLFEKYERCRAFEAVAKLKAEGKVKHMGISFHDRANVLDMILTKHPEIEMVQLQFNYLDYDHPGIESGNCYEVCCKHGKPVLVMEPCKGGSLTRLPPKALEALEQVGGGSPASYAIRFAASFDNIKMVLSGMGSLEQMKENTAFMADFKPLTPDEHAALDRVKAILREMGLIQCTACRYCVDGCPMKIAIPEYFSCLNTLKQFGDWQSEFYYRHTKGGRARECIECGQCERVCPQHLPIIELMKQVSKEFDR